jgi:hypothetical protein
MTLSESRNSSSWQGAIELGPHLMRLAEELPASEAMGLSFQLRQAMVEVPATAATADLLPETGKARVLPVLKLLAILDLIEKVYPALDTADVRTEAEKLAEYVVSAATGVEPTAALPAKIEPPAPAPADVPVVASAPTAHAEAEATPAADHAAPASPTTTVPVTQVPSEETDVHPDSVQ